MAETGAPAKVNSDSFGSPQQAASDSPSPGSSQRIFHTAVVEDYFLNPDKDLTEEVDVDESLEDKSLKSALANGKYKVSNPGYVTAMPRNSIKGIRIDDRGAYKNTSEIFFPFFPPFLCTPVIPGEKVWVTYDSGSPGGVGYWMCRKPSNLDVDDLNYTHDDRQTLNMAQSSTETNPEHAMEGTPEAIVVEPGTFPRGGGTDATSNTLPPYKWDNVSEADNPYDSIVATSPAYRLFKGEIVPRWTGRPGDATLQGSNNTLISLGKDRTFDAYNTNEEDAVEYSGTIDIVVGRGQTEKTNFSLVIDSNEREYGEGNLAPGLTGETSNINEGDVDFAEDLSRIYVSMKTSGDSNFGLEFTNPAAPQVAEVPYIIAKSTEVRLVGKDGGSVRLIKEGATQAEICLMSDGTIAIEGKVASPSIPGRTTQATMRGEDLAIAVEAFSAAITLAMPATLGNQSGKIKDGGIATACAGLATAVRAALSDDVFIK